MINIENFKTLRKLIAKTPAKKCDMHVWQDERACGTVCCIGGHAQLYIFAHDMKNEFGVYAQTKDWLGMSRSEEWALYHDYPIDGEPKPRSWKKWMLARLDHVIKTRKISNYKRVRALKGL